MSHIWPNCLSKHKCLVGAECCFLLSPPLSWCLPKSSKPCLFSHILQLPTHSCAIHIFTFLVDENSPACMHLCHNLSSSFQWMILNLPTFTNKYFYKVLLQIWKVSSVTISIWNTWFKLQYMIWCLNEDIHFSQSYVHFQIWVVCSSA